MMETIANFIDGQLVAPHSGAYLDNLNPSEGKVYSRIPDSDERDVLQAVVAASRAFAGWSAMVVGQNPGACLAAASEYRSY